jgi:thiol-disulfide isomerase/thioredoxin
MLRIPRFFRPLCWLAVAVALGAAGGEKANCQAFLSAPAAADSPARDAVLLSFYADWCDACRAMVPAVESLAQAGYAVERIDIDKRPELARRYGVQAVPCCIVIERGREIDRVTGVTTIERLTLKLGARTEGPAARNWPAPRPAWRYERPTGCRAAVVRVFCATAATGSAGGAHTVRAIGSGALVRWNGRVVVLTARHVVEAATPIVVELSTGKRYDARVLGIDAVWDCAVLVLSAPPEGVSPAEVELGHSAMQQIGNRLESCGYGPDGRLACNSGLFLGYQRCSQRPHGPDDWMVLSGHARQGDSGGPVFNERGRLVGVLWGTDGKQVIAVQAGRLHVLLDAAVPAAESGVQGSGFRTQAVAPQVLGPESPAPVIPTSADVGVTVAAKGPVLPWRSQTQKAIAAEQQEIEGLISLEKARAAAPPCCPGGSCPTPPSANSGSAGATGSASAAQAEPAKETPLSPVLTIAIVLAAFLATGLAYGVTKKKS